MKKTKYYIILLLIIITALGGMKLYKYSFYHNSFVLRDNLKHFKQVRGVEKLLHSLLYDDKPSKFWMNNYDSRHPQGAFYYWKVLLSHDDVRKSDYGKFQFFTFSTRTNNECTQIDIKIPRNNPTISSFIRNEKYSFGYCLNRCLDRPNLDKNFDGVVDLQDYKDWEQIKKTNKIPQRIIDNIDRHKKKQKEYEEWRRNNPEPLSDLDNILNELDKLDEADSLKE